MTKLCTSNWLKMSAFHVTQVQITKGPACTVKIASAFTYCDAF